MNETRLCFCGMCDKTNNIGSKSKHFNSKTHIHKNDYRTVVKGSEYIKPETDEVNYLPNDTIKDFKIK